SAGDDLAARMDLRESRGTSGSCLPSAERELTTLTRGCEADHRRGGPSPVRSSASARPLRLRFLFHLQDISPNSVEFLFKPLLVERVGAIGEFQSNICPVLWPQRVERGRKHDALLHGHVLPFVADEVAN